MNTNEIKIDALNKKYCTKKEMAYVLTRKGLEVDRPEIFEQMNYAYLIYEFSAPFYASELKYKAGLKLSKIYNLYCFHKHLASFLFNCIRDVEHRFKTAAASLMARRDRIAIFRIRFTN